MGTDTTDPELYWKKDDFECKLGFPGSKYTGTNVVLTFMMGLLLAAAFYASLIPFSETHVGQMFYERGAVPYVIVMLSAWSVAVLFVKWRKLKLQRRALEYSVLPDAPDFVLSPATAGQVHRNLYRLVDDPQRFMLLNRIERALSNLRNIGRVSDIDDILRSQADNDEDFVESTYTAVRGFIWAIPVLGFIGTVLGLSSAIGGFGGVLSKAAEISELRDALQNVTAGLSVAFETTLIGLVAAVLIQFTLTAVKSREERFLDDCNEYCHRHIVSRLKTLQVAEEDQIEGAP